MVSFGLHCPNLRLSLARPHHDTSLGMFAQSSADCPPPRFSQALRLEAIDAAPVGAFARLDIRVGSAKLGPKARRESPPLALRLCLRGKCTQLHAVASEACELGARGWGLSRRRRNRCSSRCRGGWRCGAGGGYGGGAAQTKIFYANARLLRRFALRMLGEK